MRHKQETKIANHIEDQKSCHRRKLRVAQGIYLFGGEEREREARLSSHKEVPVDTSHTEFTKDY